MLCRAPRAQLKRSRRFKPRRHWLRCVESAVASAHELAEPRLKIAQLVQLTEPLRNSWPGKSMLKPVRAHSAEGETQATRVCQLTWVQAPGCVTWTALKSCNKCAGKERSTSARWDSPEIPAHTAILGGRVAAHVSYSHVVSLRCLGFPPTSRKLPITF